MIAFNFFGASAHFHHLGIAVRSIRDVSPESEPITDPVQQVAVAFVWIDGLRYELIEPAGASSPVTQSLEKGTKILHVCYTVPDLDVAIKAARPHGFHCIRRPVPAVAFDGRRIAWLFSNQYGLFELLEAPEPPARDGQGRPVPAGSAPIRTA